MRFVRTLFFITLLLTGCSGGNDGSALKPIQQQKAGDYTVSILSDTGRIKSGATQYTLEFRTADGQLADVGAVDVAPVMEMPGMGPMMGEAKVSQSGTAGRYNVSGNLSMAGLWKFTVKFGNGQSARFSLSAQ